jgi:excisionase family DNA binding protein
MKIDEEYMTPREAAKYRKAGLSTLAKERLTGTGMPYLKIGMKILYRKSDIDAFLASKRVAA